MSDGKRGMRRGGRGKERGRVTGGVVGGGGFLLSAEAWRQRNMEQAHVK